MNETTLDDIFCLQLRGILCRAYLLGNVSDSLVSVWLVRLIGSRKPVCSLVLIENSSHGLVPEYLHVLMEDTECRLHGLIWEWC